MFKQLTSLTLVLLVGILLLPPKAYAIDFTIPETTIDATLLSNGDVEVHETHSYDFDDDFNGLTRSIYIKEGDEIVDFEASENGQSLEVEQDEALYRIMRPGSYEPVTVDLSYTIKDGVDVYQDVAEFHWGFFDSSNEVPYEDMTITIHPPEDTDDVIAYGMDTSFATESIQSDGSVQFAIGNVSDDSNGNITVAYPPELFPEATSSDEQKRDELLAQEQEGIDEAAAYASMQDRLSTFAVFFIPIAGFVLLLLIVLSSLKTRSMYKSFDRVTESVSTIPKQKLSMLATILFTRLTLPAEAMAAGLLDLIRQGYVKEHDKNQFTLLHRKGANEHEQILIEWLFDTIGQNNEFSLQELEEYAKNKKNHEAYQKYDQKWRQAIQKEVKEANLHQNKTAYRLTVGLSSLLLIPLIVLFPLYGLPMWLLFTILLFVGFVSYACFYHPRTEEGARIAHEWNIYRKKTAELSVEEMTKWKQDDLMRAIIFGIGTGDKKLKDKNNALEDVFKTQPSTTMAYSFDVTTFLALSVITSSSVNTANSQASPSSSQSGGSPGGGAGGSGGGSGAF
ncbi:DUF2207 domain-containing protein [Alkalicoccobacillus murimartini]|uniref:Membrane protein n=1 Tax=Alkalicoccobacillus murimartini TaxID=171685 RepID=A0ABT9YIL5_9BACI|nr:DUF2207 domain-containing protein [Alkalicoccobacillus murimartini]MDQ0207696.1 putative membrane protein [Alkalicoccobacillus murimartini]